MISLSSYTEYYLSLNNFNDYYTYSSRAGSIGSRPIDGFYYQTHPSGSVPSLYNSLTARTMSKNNVGAIPIPTPYNGGSLRILGCKNGTTSVSNVNIIFDRLIEVGGISAGTTDLQTISTGTLPRFSGDNKIFCFIEPGTQLATGTQRIATITYTNQNGVSGRTATSTIGGGNFGSTNSSRFFRLDVGDTGIKSVESIQLDGIIGNGTINLIVAKFVGMFINSGMIMNLTSSFANLINGNIVGGLSEIDNDACLFSIRALFNLSGLNDGTTMGNLVVKETYEI